jgi:hypothetical protein
MWHNEKSQDLLITNILNMIMIVYLVISARRLRTFDQWMASKIFLLFV